MIAPQIASEGNRGGAAMRNIILFFVLAGAAGAQSDSAAITGLVNDPSGGAIREARVPAINLNTKGKFETRANESGFYGLTSLRPGTYTLKVEAPGFKTEITS